MQIKQPYILTYVYFQQNNLFKSREEKYQSRIRLLEALATGTSEESQVENIRFSDFCMCSTFFRS